MAPSSLQWSVSDVSYEFLFRKRGHKQLLTNAMLCEDSQGGASRAVREEYGPAWAGGSGLCAPCEGLRISGTVAWGHR